MALKSITLRLDEEEYEKLRAHLAEFGDPDINVAFVLRSYIRDLNRALPIMMKSGIDLKNYFGLLGSWLKQVGTMTDFDVITRTMTGPWKLWNAAGAPAEEPERGERGGRGAAGAARGERKA
jgi:hypothetical protein